MVAMELRPGINEKNKANNVELGKIQSYKNYSDNYTWICDWKKRTSD